MDQDEYIKERLDDQIDWYDSKSRWNQRWYKRIHVFQLIAAGLIPFLSAYIASGMSFLRITVGLLGVFVAATIAVLNLYKFQENWLQYRTTCESLRHEKYLFATKSDPYDEGDPFHLLVQRAELLISSENNRWAQNMRAKHKEQDSGA